MEKVLIACEGSKKVGFGHVRRAITLADEFSKAGHVVQITDIMRSGLGIIPKEFLAQIEPTVIVADFANRIDDFLEAQSEHCPIYTLDYFGNLESSFTISLFEHFPRACTKNRISGYQFAIIRQDIVKARTFGERGKGAIVALGGADIRNMSGSVYQRLKSVEDNIKVIMGPLAAEESSVHIEPLDLIKDPPDYPQQLQNSNWGITNGGGTMLEMMCLGKAVHVLPQTDFESRLAQDLYGRGAILGIGFDSLRKYSQQEIKRVGKLASEIIDGQGPRRIVELICG